LSLPSSSHLSIGSPTFAVVPSSSIRGKAPRLESLDSLVGGGVVPSQ
jgi:hypothetical protein